MLLVAYAKLVDDKELGTLMVGVYYGGLAENEIEADDIARKCVSMTQGGIVIIRTSQLINGDFLATLKHLSGVFERMAERIYENERIMVRSIG